MWPALAVTLLLAACANGGDEGSGTSSAPRTDQHAGAPAAQRQALRPSWGA